MKQSVRSKESSDGVLILDDSIEEKPYTDENEINCWHYSHAKGDVIKGMNCKHAVHLNLPISTHR